MNRSDITIDGVLSILVVLSLACSQARPPAAQPDQALDEPSPSTSLEVGPRELQPEVLEEAPQVKPYGEKLIVIEQGGGEVEKPLTLVEAAQKERLRRQYADKSEIVITDENLPAFATGELTFTDKTFNTESGQDSPDELTDRPSVLSQESEDEWRARMLTMRLRLRDNASTIEELEAEVAQWRQRFYLEEDNYHRDTQVKPAWDRALEQLEAARGEVTTIQRQLAEAIDQGRREGVPPGWLREGIEFEPQDTPVQEEYLDPGEPVILEESSGRNR